MAAPAAMLFRQHTNLLLGLLWCLLWEKWRVAEYLPYLRQWRTQVPLLLLLVFYSQF